MYEYTAKVVKVYDADTITVDIDLGFKMVMRGMKVRLYGINAPEVRGPEKVQGKVSRDWLREQILGKEIFMKSYKGKTGKYGRWLADIYPLDAREKSFNTIMIEQGLAVMIEQGLAVAANY